MNLDWVWLKMYENIFAFQYNLRTKEQKLNFRNEYHENRLLTCWHRNIVHVIMNTFLHSILFFLKQNWWVRPTKSRIKQSKRVPSKVNIKPYGTSWIMYIWWIWCVYSVLEFTTKLYYLKPFINAVLLSCCSSTYRNKTFT